MSLQIVRFSTHPDRAPEVEDSIRSMFDAIATAEPEGIRYLAARSTDRPDFLLLLHLAAATTNPLLGIPQATMFRQRMADSALTTPQPEPMTTVGAYRVLD